MVYRIDVVFDLSPDHPYHRPTIEAVTDAATAAAIDVAVTVVNTDAIGERYGANPPDGVVIGPGAPYREPRAAENVIRSAREKGLPLVAT